MAVSLWGAVGGIAAAIGPSLGAFIVDSMSWQWAFYINLPIGAVSLVLEYARLHESRIPGKVQHVDLVGMLLLVTSVGAAALALSQSASPNWSHAAIQAIAMTAAVTLVAFVLWAARARHPLVDLKLFRSLTYSAVNLATLSFAMAFSMKFFAFFLFDDDLALQFAASRHRGYARTAASRADRNYQRSCRRQVGPSTRPGYRFDGLCGERSVAGAGAGCDARLLDAMVSRPAAERHRCRHGSAIAVRRRYRPAAAKLVWCRQRG